jgi:hypothetical protein
MSLCSRPTTPAGPSLSGETGRIIRTDYRVFVTDRSGQETILSPQEALDIVLGGRGSGDVGPLGARSVLIVSCRKGRALTALGRVGRDLPCVLVGVAADDDLDVPEGFDVLVSPGSKPPAPWVGSSDPIAEVADLAATIRRRPLAAVALVELLRISELMPVRDAVVAESFVYSMLQSGGDFRDWLAKHPHAPSAPSQELPVIVERTGDHLEIRLHRPQVHNAVNAAMRDALAEIFAVVVADGSIRSVRLAGDGPSLCSGGDLTEFGSSPDPVTAHAVRVTRSIGSLVSLCADRVVVEAHGACIGAGIEIPAFARWITTTSDAHFVLPELSLGLIPGAGGTASIARRIGRHRTAYMALRQCVITAQTALEWGLVNEMRVT